MPSSSASIAKAIPWNARHDPPDPKQVADMIAQHIARTAHKGISTEFVRE
jgi:hypothetical protein